MVAAKSVSPDGLGVNQKSQRKVPLLAEAQKVALALCFANYSDGSLWQNLIGVKLNLEHFLQF